MLRRFSAPTEKFDFMLMFGCFANKIDDVLLIDFIS